MVGLRGDGQITKTMDGVSGVNDLANCLVPTDVCPFGSALPRHCAAAARPVRPRAESQSNTRRYGVGMGVT